MTATLRTEKSASSADPIQRLLDLTSDACFLLTWQGVAHPQNSEAWRFARSIANAPQELDFLSCFEPASRGKLKRLIEKLKTNTGEPCGELADLRLSGDKASLTRDGTIRVFKVTVSVGDGDALCAVMRDTTQETNLRRQVYALSVIDPLTYAQSRLSLLNYVNHCRSVLDGAESALLVLDLDHFKLINDMYGYAAGDQALQSVAIAVEEVVARHNFARPEASPAGMLARVGGEEFAVYLPEATRDAARDLANEVRSVVSRTVVQASSGASFALTGSVGYWAGGLEGADLDHMLRVADSALFRAKEEGRNRVVGAEKPGRLPPGERRVARGDERI